LEGVAVAVAVADWPHCRWVVCVRKL
jgi:hypothetical protein